MGELGDLLKRTRAEKNITLKEVEQATKIQSRMLRALEEEDFSYFAGEVYVRGALRNYARYLGLDPKEVLSLYPGKKPTTEIAQPQNQNQVEQPIRRRENKALTVMIIIVIIALALTAYYLLLAKENDGQSGRPPYDYEAPSDHNPDEDPEDENPEPPGDSDTPPEAPLEPGVELTDGGNGSLVYSLTGAEDIQLQFEFTGLCWIDLRVDGEAVFDRTFRGGDRHTQVGDREIWVRLGNPLGVKLTVNGIILEEVSSYENPINVTISRQE